MVKKIIYSEKFIFISEDVSYIASTAICMFLAQELAVNGFLFEIKRAKRIRNKAS